MKLFDILRLLVQRPNEAYGRLEGMIDRQYERFCVPHGEYRPDTMEAVLQKLEMVLSLELQPALQDPGLNEIREHILTQMKKLPSHAPFPLYNNGDFALAQLCYVICRAFRPSRVLETGVCYGVTTAFILKALNENGVGELHSIDLPPLGRKVGDYIGLMVPKELRFRWRLHRGATKAVLPKLLSEIAPVNLFVHDSLHSYRNMSRELRTVNPSLSRPAVVISDDIEGNPAFDEWAGQAKPHYWAALRAEKKESMLGVAVIGATETPSQHRC